MLKIIRCKQPLPIGRVCFAPFKLEAAKAIVAAPASLSFAPWLGALKEEKMAFHETLSTKYYD